MGGTIFATSVPVQSVKIGFSKDLFFDFSRDDLSLTEFFPNFFA